MFLLKDGVTACVPSTTINQLAILPCIEQYDGQFFDTKCELALVLSNCIKPHVCLSWKVAAA